MTKSCRLESVLRMIEDIFSYFSTKTYVVTPCLDKSSNGGSQNMSMEKHGYSNVLKYLDT